MTTPSEAKHLSKNIIKMAIEYGIPVVSEAYITHCDETTINISAYQLPISSTNLHPNLGWCSSAECPATTSSYLASGAKCDLPNASRRLKSSQKSDMTKDFKKNPSYHNLKILGTPDDQNDDSRDSLTMVIRRDSTIFLNQDGEKQQKSDSEDSVISLFSINSPSALNSGSLEVLRSGESGGGSGFVVSGNLLDSTSSLVSLDSISCTPPSTAPISPSTLSSRSKVLPPVQPPPPIFDSQARFEWQKLLGVYLTGDEIEQKMKHINLPAEEVESAASPFCHDPDTLWSSIFSVLTGRSDEEDFCWIEQNRKKLSFVLVDIVNFKCGLFDDENELYAQLTALLSRLDNFENNFPSIHFLTKRYPIYGSTAVQQRIEMFRMWTNTRLILHKKIRTIEVWMSGGGSGGVRADSHASSPNDPFMLSPLPQDFIDRFLKEFSIQNLFKLGILVNLNLHLNKALMNFQQHGELLESLKLPVKSLGKNMLAMSFFSVRLIRECLNSRLKAAVNVTRTTGNYHCASKFHVSSADQWISSTLSSPEYSTPPVISPKRSSAAPPALSNLPHPPLLRQTLSPNKPCNPIDILPSGTDSVGVVEQLIEDFRICLLAAIQAKNRFLSYVTALYLSKIVRIDAGECASLS